MSKHDRVELVGGIFGLTFVILFFGKVLALGQFGTWSWWWITSPLWAPPTARMGVGFAVSIVRGLFRSTMQLFK